MRRARFAASLACAALVATGAVALVAPGCTPAFRTCDPPPAAALDALPARLSETGLFADLETETLGEGVRPFAPRFQLWTDGAEKRRWIALPAGSAIDTRDVDAWDFPIGTRLWKELTVAGVRVETRLLSRFGPDASDWAAAAYVWSNDGDAYLSLDGAVAARGTPHDVPSAADCAGCHGGTRSRILGFSAIQLTMETLEGLAAEGLLEGPVPPDNALPGDGATQAALGYLHANCAHCHNQRRPEAPGARCFDPAVDLDFELRTAALATFEATATFRTGIGDEFIPGDPDGSEALIRLRSRDPWWGMPALGTKRVDDVGASLLERWIRGLP